MYARSTTIKGDPGNIDAGITYIRDEVMPAITAMDGCAGMSLVVDRSSGQCIATSSWRDEASMHASGDRLASYRARGGEVLGGTPTVEEWEVAVMHRDHQTSPGACCRITWTRASDLDGTVEFWKSRVLTQLEGMDGFCSASFLIDRAGSRTCGTAVFDSQAALDATRADAARMRETATREMGVEFLDIAEFELAIAHLRVPELV
ncbi:hypothetical protein FB382_001321 [Nocardioides ginsengisegetis]|uniref:Antibiotic biosynthesis monooxygenase n=1 Tax=Nocardioides ginsengisegetis TaxID=661491 RepID=A0A7W3IYM1_9ACTN|nr:hypothetical protein [Nocardioides ginsengisegetis]MBA8803030.1 hypothetical protein [Nocardioides ginsengisegetis]